MKWLKEVLDRNAIVNIESPEGRALLAQAIVEALPAQLIATTIRESARAVLAMRLGEGHISIAEAELAAEVGAEALALEAPTMPRSEVLVAMSKISVEYSKLRANLDGLARELGNNCAASVLLMLEVDDLELDDDVASRFNAVDSDAPVVP